MKHMNHRGCLGTWIGGLSYANNQHRSMWTQIRKKNITPIFSWMIIKWTQRCPRKYRTFTLLISFLWNCFLVQCKSITSQHSEQPQWSMQADSAARLSSAGQTSPCPWKWDAANQSDRSNNPDTITMTPLPHRTLATCHMSILTNSSICLCQTSWEQVMFLSVLVTACWKDSKNCEICWTSREI